MLGKSLLPKEMSTAMHLDRQLTIANDSLDFSNNILDTLREPFLVLNEDLEVVSAAKAFYSTFKVLPEKTIGKLIYDLGNGQWNIPSLKLLLEDMLPENKIIINYNVKHNFESIGQRTMLLNARRVYRESKAMPMILLAIEDITERTKSEQLIQKALAYAESIIDTVREPLLMLDSDLRVISANRSFYQTYVVKPGETEGQLVYDLGNHQWDIPKLRELLEQILPRDDSFNDFEIEHNFESIGERTMLLNARRIYRESKETPMILLAIEDITELKYNENIRLELEGQLRQSQKLEAVGTMVGGISHELNNLLQSIFLYSGLIQEKLPADENVQTYFTFLLNAAHSARDIVKQVLTFSRKSKVEMVPHAIHEIILENLSLVRSSLPANIELHQDIDMNCGMVMSDQTQINQIILNLCNNAVHAMKEKGGTLTVSLQQVMASINQGNSKTDALELIVGDTGHGMDSARQEKIFDPFFTTKAVGQGTGLGLSVVHGIVESMQGEISVASELEMATTFRVLLPIAEEIIEGLNAKPSARPDIHKGTILLVDDEENIRVATEYVLTKVGHVVESATDGQKALDLFNANPTKYDLIVTDLSMPNLSGGDLAKEVRRLKSEVPIILSTGQLGIEDMKELMNIGITAFIHKPWTIEELLWQIKELDIPQKYQQPFSN